MNKIIKKIAAMIIALTLVASSVAFDSNSTASAAAWGMPYQKADTIVSGETYVFFANISNNLSQSDPADRLLTADLWRPMNQNGTSTTDFVTDQYGTLWNDYNDLSDYEYVITEVSGDMNEGNQGYRIVQKKSGNYLDVTQDMQPTKHEGSNKRFKAGQEIRNFDGEIYPTLAYVCISDTPRTWYWNQSRGEFYTLYTSNLKNSGTAVTGMFTDDKEAGTVYAYQENNKNYLVNWGGYAYIDYYDRDFVGYVDMGTADIQVSFHSNMKLYLCAVNAGTGYHENHRNNLAEALHNPLYYFYKTYSWMGSGGCASLSVNNVGFIYGNVPDGGSHAEKQKVALYRKTASCSLEVICGNGSGDRPRGVAIDISANENTRDDHFVKWKVVSGDCVIENPEDRNTKITINSDTAKIEAVFEPHSYVDDHDCSTALYCSVCGDLLASISNHLFDEYTNPSPGFHEKKCEWCNVSIDYGACTYTYDIYPATCNSAKRCDICWAEEPGGEKDPDNHESEKTVWQQTETTHTLVHQCCGAVVEAETLHTWQNGKCTVCGYSCLHKGGEATCTQKAVCEICHHPYGEIDGANHAPASEWTQQDGKHYHICENGCGTHLDESACSGGEASYFVKAICETCQKEYGTLVTDSTDPVGEITVSEHTWNRFLNSITLGAFFKDTQEVTITASDDSYSHEGYTEEKAAKIEYYLHTGETALTEADLESKEFTEYSCAFNINPNSKYVVYARITDHAGNVTYLSSDGIVLYTDARQDTENITFVKTTTEDITASVITNGNTIKEIRNGETVLSNDDYNVSYDGNKAMITFKAAYLDTLASGGYTLTLSYNPLGVEYQDGNDNAAPNNTIIALTVNRQTGAVTNISDISKIYDNTAVSAPTYDFLSSGTAVIEYKAKGADDSTYTQTAPNTVGEYTVRITVAEDENYAEASTTRDFDISYLDAPQEPYALIGPAGTNGWYTGDVTLKPADGYTVSTTLNGTYSEHLLYTETSEDIIVYLKNRDGQMTGAITAGTVKIDRTAPDGDIKFEENSVKKFINKITFGLFFNEDIDVEITGTDDLSGVAKIEYYRSDKVLTEEEVAAITDWTETDKKFSVNSQDKEAFIYYVRITDQAGNITFFGSDGAAFDLTTPVIGGAENGVTCYVTQEVTVSDENLNSVTLNGKPVKSSLTLDGNMDATYTIVAADKAGNVTEYTVTMKPIESLGEPIEDLTTGNVTSDDKKVVEEVKEAISSIDTEDATREEKAALKELTDKCDALLEKIKKASEADKTENTEKVEDITSESVMPDDKKDLEAAREDLEKALEDYGDNLTDEEKAEIEKKIENIDNALDSLEKAETAEDTITKLSDTVKPDDTDAEKLIDEAKKQYDALTEHEKSLVSQEAREKLESLLAALSDYEIVKGDGSKWQKGTKAGLSFTANGACSKFTGIEVDGKAVDENNYKAVSGSTIITLKPEYLETLSTGEHTLTVKYTDGKASCKFEVLTGTAEENAAGDETGSMPATGDRNNIVMWAVLLIISAGAAAAVISRKKN